MMRKQIIRFGIIFAAIAVAMAWETGPAAAQGKPWQVINLLPARHAVSPPLSQVRPIPPSKGLERVMPLLLTHPVPTQRLIQRDPVLQQSTVGIANATAGLGFTGIGVGLGNFSDDWIPPDTNGAAGSTQYVQWVNSSFAVFNKLNGSVEYGPADGNTLWQALGGACYSNNSGDPIAQYDKQANRWVMMQPVFTKPYYLCIAVSTTPDATGSYNLYQFPVPNNTKYFPDYPKLAVWPDGYYISFNSFQGNRYLGPTACVADRTAMLAGSPNPGFPCTNPLGSGYSSLLPADLDGALPGVSGTTSPPPAEADYYLNFGTNSLTIWQFSSDHSTFSSVATIQVPSFSEACGGGACIPQANTKEQLDSLGDRMMYRLAYRNINGTETLVASQSVDTGTSSGNTGIRWYDLQKTNSGWTAAQASTWNPDSNYRWMPSIAMDKAQDIALGYSVSSSGIFPAISFTGHDPSAGDASGAMETETGIISGSGSQTSYNRWGDYSSMSVDPTDDCTFWYTNEYLQSTGNFNWSTQITPIRFSNCPTLGLSVGASGSTSGDPAMQTVTAGDSTTYDLSVNPSDSSVTTTFNESSVDGLPTGASASFSSGSVTGSGSTTLTVSTSSSTPVGTYTLSIPATGSNGVTNVISVVLIVKAGSTGGGGSFTLTSSQSTQTASQSSSATYKLTLTPSGFNGTVDLSVRGVPPQSSASFSPSSSISLSSSTAVAATLTVYTGAHTPTKQYTLTITGTDPSGTVAPQSITVTLTVQ